MLSMWVSGGIYFQWQQRFVAMEAEAAMETETAVMKVVAAMRHGDSRRMKTAVNGGNGGW
jgi:hypothetical protein